MSCVDEGLRYSYVRLTIYVELNRVKRRIFQQFVRFLDSYPRPTRIPRLTKILQSRGCHWVGAELSPGVPPGTDHSFLTPGTTSATVLGPSLRQPLSQSSSHDRDPRDDGDRDVGHDEDGDTDDVARHVCDDDGDVDDGRDDASFPHLCHPVCHHGQSHDVHPLGSMT